MADSSIANLGTEMTSPALNDLLAIVNDPGGTPETQKIQLQNLLKVINLLTADSAPDLDADYALSYDASAGAVKKVLLRLLSPIQAWINFNGTGTPAIRDDFNVSSITDNGTGTYTINFSSALNNANYSVGGTVAGSGTTSIRCYDDSAARTTTAVKVICAGWNGSTFVAVDPTHVNLIVVGS